MIKTIGGCKVDSFQMNVWKGEGIFALKLLTFRIYFNLMHPGLFAIFKCEMNEFNVYIFI